MNSVTTWTLDSTRLLPSSGYSNESFGEQSSALTHVTGKHKPKPGDWITVREACAYLGVINRTLYRFIDKLGLPAYQIGRVIRLRQHEVDAWLAERRIAPGSLEHLYRVDDEP